LNDITPRTPSSNKSGKCDSSNADAIENRKQSFRKLKIHSQVYSSPSKDISNVLDSLDFIQEMAIYAEGEQSGSSISAKS